MFAASGMMTNISFFVFFLYSNQCHCSEIIAQTPSQQLNKILVLAVAAGTVCARGPPAFLKSQCVRRDINSAALPSQSCAIGEMPVFPLRLIQPTRCPASVTPESSDRQL